MKAHCLRYQTTAYLAAKTLFLNALLLLPLHAEAASFDCSQARTTLEVLICSNPTLSSLDGEVGNAYTAAQSAIVSGSSQSALLLEEQREFLRQRIKVCPIPATPQISEDESAEIVNCLINFYSVRLSTLRKQNDAFDSNGNQPDTMTHNADVVVPTAPISSPEDDSENSSYAPSLLLLLIAGAVIFCVVMTLREKNKRFNMALEIIKSRAQDLAIRKQQLTIPGAYGVVDQKPWVVDIAFFLDNIIVPAIGRFNRDERIRLCNAIDKVASSHIPEKQAQGKLSPLEYEASVALRLQENGWNARLTKGSGDQGIDVIATKNGHKLVIQCKLYTNPVGNAAVQEIIAGRAFEKADYAAVVSNIGYTKAARQLAANADVLLLHHDELDSLESKLAV